MDRPDRPMRRTDRDSLNKQRPRSHQQQPGMRGNGQQQHLTSGGNYSSTESENEEGAAVYESLTRPSRRPLVPSTNLQGNLQGPPNGASGELVARLMYNPNSHNDPRLGLGLIGVPPVSKEGARMTNLDDHDSPLTNRKDYSKTQLYELLRLGSERESPETDDVISQTSNEHNASECPTIPVNGSSSHTGSYIVNPSTANSDNHSCTALSSYPVYQPGVQQLSAQHLHNNPYLTSSFTSNHQHHHRPHPNTNSIYYSNQDPHLLHDSQDNHASSPTTSSDRCLLPASSCVNVGKLSSHNSSVMMTSDRHLFNPGSISNHHNCDLRDRPLSDHYLANSILRSSQCPIHATSSGMLFPSRTNMRPASTAKPQQKSRGIRRFLLWRNICVLLGLMCLALVAALGYFVVVSGKHQDDISKCSRAQEVISQNRFNSAGTSSGLPPVREKRNAEPLFAENTSNGISKTSSQNTKSQDVQSTGVFDTIWNILNPYLGVETQNLTNSSNVKNSENVNEQENNQLQEPGFYSVNRSLTKSSELWKGTNNLANESEEMEQNDRPATETLFSGQELFDQPQSFTILQTVFLSHYIDSTGHSQPRIVLQSPQVFSRDKSLVVSRSGRDLNDIQSWDEKDFPFTLRDIYPSEEETVEVQHGSTIDVHIPARSFWSRKLIQKRPGTVQFNLTTSATATLVLYGRRDHLPTHAQNDFVNPVRGSREKRAVLENSGSEVHVLREKLDSGTWFLSLYNDQGTEERAQLFTGVSEDSACPNDCSNQGTCIDGRCECSAGFGGEDCSQAVCPLLCNGHGKYVHGSCQCNSGWKGTDCDVPEFQCSDPLCSGHGKCWNGKCVCDSGFFGTTCEAVMCGEQCALHGVCINGTCFCQPGWQGVLCDFPVNDTRKLCSYHGELNLVSKKCDCDSKWVGDSCNIEICQPGCGVNGRCNGGKCECNNGWVGPTCTVPQCPPCGPRGRCSNGICLCQKGWSGKLCVTNSCPNDCSGHGSCVKNAEAWKCQCEAFWKGDNCNVAIEKCDDTLDNDGDGLVDCDDNDCCSSEICADKPNCNAAPEPQDVLLREQAPPDTASFYERVRFLVRENGVQSYVDRGSYDPDRVSVIRGRVIDSSNVGLVGVRVGLQPISPTIPSPWGATISRRDGMFDLLINGGGSQTVEFQKGGYRKTTTTVAVGWNEFVLTEPVKMSREAELSRSRVDFILPSSSDADAPCEIADSHFQPRVLPFWKLFPSGGLGNGAVVYYDAQVLQESFNISGSDLRLSYFSSRAVGFSSLVLIVLTEEKVNSGLTRVTVRVANAGLQEEVVYDARANLSHLYSWNGFNAYKQQVFGVSNAKVSIGYEGTNCKELFWVHMIVKIKGFDLPVSEIGGWDLNIQHRYNSDGILHRGDGSNVYFSEGVLEVTPVVGTGQIRPINCKDGCLSGTGLLTDLLAPVALASGLEGSLYIGDFNLIRRFKPDGTMISLFQLQSPAMLQKYFMAVNPTNGQVYVSVAQMLKVIQISSQEIPQDLSTNFNVVVGNGMQCLPRDGVFDCGEAVLATAASMIFPKGIAFDKSGILYVADGGAVRFVDEGGLIKTLIPNVPYAGVWSPLGCDQTADLENVNLRWPTALSINPVDNSLYILDDSIVLRLDKYRKVVVVAGHSSKCGDNKESTILDSPTAIAVSNKGILYVTEGNAGSWQIRKIDNAGSQTILNSCSSCNSSSCGCIPTSKYSAKMSFPAAISIRPDGLLHVADLKALRIFRVGSAVPRLNNKMEYQVESPELGEVYTFDRHGHHTTTANLFTGLQLYRFGYTVDTAFGKVRSVYSSNGATLVIQRDYRSQIKSLESGTGWKMTIQSTPRGFLKEIIYNDGHQISFAYEPETGMIIGRSDSAGKSFGYAYDNFGRLSQVTYPNGKRFSWPAVTDKMSLAQLSPSYVNDENDGKSFLSVPSRFVISIDSQNELPFFNISAASTIFFRADSNQSVTVERHYVNQKEPTTRLRRSLKVSDNNLLNIDFISSSNEEVVSDRDNVPFVSTKFDAKDRPILLKILAAESFVATNFTYDLAGRLLKWQQGPRWKSTTYNQFGLPVSQTTANDASWKFEYNEKKKPSKITTALGSQIILDYDAVGGLQSVTSPKGNTVVLREEPFIFFRRYSIRDLQSDSAFSQGFNDIHQLVSQDFPSGLRRRTLIYDENDKLKFEFHGRDSLNYFYNEHGLIVNVTATSGDLTSVMDVSYISNLLVSTRTSKYSGVQLEPISASYEYDSKFNLLRRKILVGNSDISVTDFQIHPKTGQLSRFGPFSLSQGQTGAQIVTDDNTIFLKQLDSFGKVRNHVLRLQQRIVATSEMLYNDVGQLAELKIRKRESEPQLSYSFKYDLDGQLIEATKNKMPWWNYSYDRNGNLLSLSGNGRSRNMSFGTRDELLGITSDGIHMEVMVDSDGFVVKKGEVRYSFDARSQLRRSWKEGSGFDVKYHYDEQKRLIARQNSGLDISQFIYGDLDQPELITHIFLHKTRTLMQLFYDTTGQLIALAKDGNPYYVLQSKLSATLFDQQGKIIKEMFLSPFGHVESDSNPEFYFPFDETNNIRDELTGVTFHGSRAYDPELGRFLSPDFGDLRQFSLSRLNPYILNRNDPLLSEKEKEAFLNADKWASVLGLSTGACDNSQILLSNVIGLDCQFDAPLTLVNRSCLMGETIQNFQSLSLVGGQRSMLPDILLKPHRLAAVTPFYGKGTIIVSQHDGSINIVNTGIGPRVFSDAMVAVLNSSQLVPWHISSKTKEKIFAVKTGDSAALDEDILRLRSAMPSLTVTSKREVGDVSLAIQAENLVFNISYVPEITPTLITRFKNFLLEETSRKAWEYQKSGQPGVAVWSESEKTTLFRNGFVPSYKGEFIRDLVTFPELANDPANVAFKRS